MTQHGEALNNLEEDSEASKAYYTALYRERYVNYKSLNFGNP